MCKRLAPQRSISLLQNILAVASGTAIGQTITLAFAPLITRIYTPEVFGLQGMFLSLVSILAPLIALRLPLAIVIAKDADEVQQLSHLTCIIALGLSAILALILVYLREPIAILLGVESLGKLIYLLPCALFLFTLQDVMDYRSARLKIFRVVAIVTVAQALIANLARALGGLISPVAMTLMAVTSIAPGIQALLLACNSRAKFGPAPVVNWRVYRNLIVKYREFPIYRSPTDMINAAAQSVPVIMLTSMYSPAMAGLYVLARSVLSLPTNIIGSAIGNVLYSRFAELARENKPLLPLAVKSTLVLFALTPFIITVCQFAPSIFGFIFGENWRASGNFTQWMSLWIAFLVTNIATVRALPVIGAQQLHLIYNLVTLSGGIAALWIGNNLFNTALGSIAIFCIAMAVLYATQIMAYLYLIRKFDRRAKHYGPD